jgi:DNA-binding CsgD family transcriptional regulator
MRLPGRANHDMTAHVDDLLLTLYHLAADTPPGEFPTLVMGLVQPLIGFDCAGQTSLERRAGTTRVASSSLYRERAEMLAEWQTISDADPVLSTCLRQPRRSLAFHAPTVATAIHDPAMRNYIANNRQHQNGLVVVAPGAIDQTWDALGFYRADSTRQFSRRDMRMADQLAPHMVQAIRLNRLAAGARPSAVETGSAIAGGDGQLQYAAPGFAETMRGEWPQWEGATLPRALLAALGNAGRHYQGRTLSVTATLSGTVLLLQVKTISPLQCLTPRERTAALLFGAGKSSKELARAMNITPNTARNFVQQIYRKLAIGDKAALATMVAKESAHGAAPAPAAPPKR